MGIFSARKLKQKSKKKRNANKTSNQQQATTHVSGIVKEMINIHVKSPNSGIKTCVKVELCKNKKEVLAFVPCDGGVLNLDENDSVLLEKKKKKDVTNCHYFVIKFNHICLKDFCNNKEKYFRDRCYSGPG
ncbi:hypothetical protein ABK040_004800 [Willaertia magna]